MSLDMYERLRRLDYQIEIEMYECEGKPASAKLRALRAERRKVSREISEFVNDPITQSISL